MHATAKHVGQFSNVRLPMHTHTHTLGVSALATAHTRRQPPSPASSLLPRPSLHLTSRPIAVDLIETSFAEVPGLPPGTYTIHAEVSSVEGASSESSPANAHAKVSRGQPRRSEKAWRWLR